MRRFIWFISLLGLRFQASYKVEQTQYLNICLLVCKWLNNTASQGQSCLQKAKWSKSQPTQPAEQVLCLYHFIRTYQHDNFQDQPANCIVCVAFTGWIGILSRFLKLRFISYVCACILGKDTVYLLVLHALSSSETKTVKTGSQVLRPWRAKTTESFYNWVGAAFCFSVVTKLIFSFRNLRHFINRNGQK